MGLSKSNLEVIPSSAFSFNLSYVFTSVVFINSLPSFGTLMPIASTSFSVLGVVRGLTLSPKKAGMFKTGEVDSLACSDGIAMILKEFEVKWNLESSK